jgi:hypothetical protein
MRLMSFISPPGKSDASGARAARPAFARGQKSRLLTCLLTWMKKVAIEKVDQLFRRLL